MNSKPCKMDNRKWTLCCFNPFSLPNHSHVKKGLRPVTKWICSLFPEITKFTKVCDRCRKKLSKLQNDYGKDEISILPGTCHNLDTASESDTDLDLSCSFETLKILNKTLHELRESPIDKRKSKSKKYSTAKAKRINTALKRKLLLDAELSDNESNEESILNNLKIKFKSPTTSRKEKMMILTLLPETWSIRRIMREFNVSNYMIRQSKKLLKQKGFLSFPDQKPGKSLDTETAETIRAFYKSDEISRSMPGMKDYISLKDTDGKKIHVSKRLILGNLKEIYRSFKEKYPEIKVGFSKFAELRPKNCVLSGHSGTHAVCVCTAHQNVKLMIENAKLPSLTKGAIKNYKDCLQKITCNPPTVDCYLNNCSLCPGIHEIRTILENAFEENIVENVYFRQWISVDRCTLDIIQKTASEFIELFCERISKLLYHDFIAKQQSLFINEVKQNLAPSELAILCDFSENYNFIVQDEVQSYHWTTNQATIHPFVILYYKRNEKIEHYSFVIILESLEHNTAAVFLFQKKMIEFLKNRFERFPTKIYYFSDGCAAQYKNEKKNFFNLCQHKNDFNILAEWHFSATAHGKVPCDGIGGTVKRLAARANLQRPFYDQITTPKQLYEWAKQNINGIDFAFVTLSEHRATKENLEERFIKAKAVPGTQKFHAFIPLNERNISVKPFSFSQVSGEYPVSILKKMNNLNVYVAEIYNLKSWLKYVLENKVMF